MFGLSLFPTSIYLLGSFAWIYQNLTLKTKAKYPFATPFHYAPPSSLWVNGIAGLSRLLGENQSSDSSLSIDSWYLIIKSIHLISTIILSCVSSLPFPFDLLLFFIFYPDSYIQQIIPEHLPQARHKLYTLETRKWTKQTKFLPSRSFHSGQGVQTLNK